MATDKKHIAVYLAPEVEQALIAFCEQKGLKSKKGTMFSAGVNAALAEFFGVSVTESSNIPSKSSNTLNNSGNIPSKSSNTLNNSGNIPVDASTIPTEVVSNILTESVVIEVSPGKLESGDSKESPKVDNEVVEQLQNELGNLKDENEKLRADYAALLESSTHVTNKLQQEVQEVRSQLETVQANPPITPVAEFKLPEPASALNLLKGKRKKSKADLGDVEALWEILGDF